MLLIAAEASDLVEQVYETLKTWSSLGLLETFIFNDSTGTDSGIRSRIVQSGEAREEPLDHLLANFLGDLTIFWLTTSVSENDVTELSGRVAARHVLEATSQMVANLKELTRLRVFASNRPGTIFSEIDDEGWPFRVFLVPEDRARPDALSNLIPERFAAHVAAGLASLGNLWPSPRPESAVDITKWMVEDQQGNNPGAVWLVRQFTKVVELPTLFGELLGGASLDELAYPNPSQEEFERVDFADRVASFAKTFVGHFEELQPVQPELVHDDPPAKSTLLHAIEELFSYMVSRLVMKPVELLDETLGRLYDSAASVVEHAFPGKEISVERWSEIGTNPAMGSEAVNELIHASNALVEGNLGRVWDEYWKLCTSLIDGGPSIDILGDQLFLTTKDRRQIAKVPSDVVLDPLNAAKEPTQGKKNADATSPGPSVKIEAIPTISTDASADIEVTVEELSKPADSALLANGVVDHGSPIDRSFAGRVQSEIDRLLKGVSKQVSEIDKQNVQVASAPENEPAGSLARRSWLSKLFHRSRPKVASNPDKVNRKTTRRIRRTFLLGAILAVAGTAFLVWKQHPLWAIGCFVVVIILSCVKALSHAFVGGKREKAAVREERSRQVALINSVITEATLRFNVQRLDRRLSEVTEWNRIIGMVVHHPWRFGENMDARRTAVTLPLPLSVVRAAGVLEGSRIKALQYQFNGFLFQKGWLGARFKELEERALREITEISGNAGAGTLQMIESDTSLDPESPRRLLARIVESTLTADGDDSDLRAKVNEFLDDDRPLGHLITEVEEFDPDNQTETGAALPIGDYFDSLRLAGGVFLSAHWLDATSEGESGVNASVVVGDGENASLVVRVSSDGGAVMPARMVCVNVQKSKRIGLENLRAFQLTDQPVDSLASQSPLTTSLLTGGERVPSMPVPRPADESKIIGQRSTEEPAIIVPEQNPSAGEVEGTRSAAEANNAELAIESDLVQPEPRVATSDQAKRREDLNVIMPPTILGDGMKFPVGKQMGNDPDTEVFYWPGNTALSQLNIGIAGDLGTGKTQLTKMIVTQLRRESVRSQSRKLPILIFDYKCDFQDAAFLSEVGGRVLLPHQIPLNVLLLSDNSDQMQRVERARAFTDIIAKIFKSIGPRQRNLLFSVIVEFYDKNGFAPTIDEVMNDYRDGAGEDDGVVAVLNAFVLYQVFSIDRSAQVTFEQLLGDDVLVVDLSTLKTDQDMKNAIVALFLNEYYEYMITQTKWPYVGESPQLRCVNSYLMVDEASNIMKYDFSALESLLLQGREFGVGVILSSQYLSHFEESNTDYSQTLRTWFVHRVPNITARGLKNLGIPTASESQVEELKGLENHESYFVSYGFDGVFIEGLPFFELVSRSSQ